MPLLMLSSWGRITAEAYREFVPPDDDGRSIALGDAWQAELVEHEIGDRHGVEIARRGVGVGLERREDGPVPRAQVREVWDRRGDDVTRPGVAAKVLEGRIERVRPEVEQGAMLAPPCVTPSFSSCCSSRSRSPSSWESFR